MEARKIEEIEFHNKLRSVTDDIHVSDTRWSPEMEDTIRDNPLWVNMKYYAIERRSRQFILNWFQTHCKGKRVLDYCCGNGDDSLQCARAGAREVIGIDLSDVSVGNCIELARRQGASDRVRFEVRDAEHTGFPDEAFDIITEYGSLHHLELDRAFGELARLVKKDGLVICNEALAHNVAIHLYRKFTPQLRTPWEVKHILKRQAFAVARRYFNEVELHFFHFFTLAAVPFRRTPIFKPLLRALELLDSLALRIPGFRWQARQVVFILKRPNKDAVARSSRTD